MNIPSVAHTAFYHTSFEMKCSQVDGIEKSWNVLKRKHQQPYWIFNYASMQSMHS